MDLPKELRHRIYREAGVINGSSIRLCSGFVLQTIQDQWSYDHFSNNYSGLFHVRSSDGTSPACVAFDCPGREEKTDLFHNLSMSSSLVSTDVAGFLYTYNEVLLCCEDSLELGMLFHPRFQWLNVIQKLTIHLGLGGALRLREGLCYHRNWSRDDKRYRSASREFKLLMCTWSEVVQRLARFKSSKVTKLDLKVLCNVENVATAQQVIRPLLHHQLAVSAIRLGNELDNGLTVIARDAVLSTNRVKDQPFLFFKAATRDMSTHSPPY